MNSKAINDYLRCIEKFESLCFQLRALTEAHIRSPKEGYRCHLDLCFEYQELWRSICPDLASLDAAFYANLRREFGRLAREFQATCMLKTDQDIELLVTSTFTRTSQTRAIASTYLPDMTRLQKD